MGRFLGGDVATVVLRALRRLQVGAGSRTQLAEI